MCKLIRDRFINGKKLDLEESSIRAYESDLNSFYSYIQATTGLLDEVAMLKEINYNYIEDYRDHLLYEATESITTVNRRFMTIKQFVEYLAERQGIIPFNYMKGFKVIKVNANNRNIKHKKAKEIITMEEFEKLISQTHVRERGSRKFDFISKRDRFLFSFLATTGMRIEQALNIHFSDIEKKEGYYIVALSAENNKTDKAIRVPICGITKKYYEEYKEEYIKEYGDISQEEKLFITLRGGKLTGNKVNEALEKYLTRAGIEKKITVHCFRTFFRTFANAVGMSDGLIRLVGGWSLSDQVEKIYLRDGECLDSAKVEFISKMIK